MACPPEEPSANRTTSRPVGRILQKITLSETPEKAVMRATSGVYDPSQTEQYFSPQRRHERTIEPDEPASGREKHAKRNAVGPLHSPTRHRPNKGKDKAEHRS